MNVTHKKPYKRYEGKTNDLLIAFIGYANDLNKLQQFKVSVQKSLLPSYSKNAKTSGELHILLSRELKRALKSKVGFLNTYFELLQFIEIIYITNKCNQ